MQYLLGSRPAQNVAQQRWTRCKSRGTHMSVSVWVSNWKRDYELPTPGILQHDPAKDTRSDASLVRSGQARKFHRTPNFPANSRWPEGRPGKYPYDDCLLFVIMLATPPDLSESGSILVYQSVLPTCTHIFSFPRRWAAK